jgi:hypothetical protein
MRQKLNQVNMNKGSNPTILFETLAAIEDQYDGFRAIEEADLTSIVLNVATDEYQKVLTAEQSANGDNMTLQDLKIVMTQHYCQKKVIKQTNTGIQEKLTQERCYLQQQQM